MTKIDIISGFLGAGKTTLINRLIKEAYKNEKVVLIENEFGEIGIDGGFLKGAGIEISEMNSGCICCSLVGDFSKALKQVIAEYAPDRILIEPSGVGKLSDVTKAVLDADLDNVHINSAVVVVDVNKCKMYMKNFGEFFGNQIENAGCILFSHTDKTTDAKLSEALSLIREKNSAATIVTTPHDYLDIPTLIKSFEKPTNIDAHLSALKEEESCPICAHHHHHHDDHHHHHDDHHHHHDDHHRHHDDHEHHHEHHEHNGHCHEEHDDHDNCHCDHHDEHCHHHHHDHHEHEHNHHHHHADDIFSSWGKETVKRYSSNEISALLKELDNSEKYGIILRAKGIVKNTDSEWIYFDYIPEEIDVRTGTPDVIGKICVIGSKINEEAISNLFGI